VAIVRPIIISILVRNRRPNYVKLIHFYSLLVNFILWAVDSSRSGHCPRIKIRVSEGFGTHDLIKLTNSKEGWLPIVVFIKIKDHRVKLQQAAKINIDKVSHFNLPATLYGLSVCRLSAVSW
jgi:hypothetical protein